MKTNIKHMMYTLIRQSIYSSPSGCLSVVMDRADHRKNLMLAMIDRIRTASVSEHSALQCAAYRAV